jgi:protein-disulfide isomerase
MFWRRKKRNHWSFWLAVIIVLGLLTWLIIQLATPPVENDNYNTDILTIQNNDWIKGNPEAKVVLMEYSDFQCPYCQIYGKLTSQLAEEFSEDIAVVFRHFPLKTIHPNAEIASQAAEAAGLQNKFWEMGDLIFNNQNLWINHQIPEEIFTNFAGLLELDVERFKTDINSSPVKDKINEQIKRSTALDIQGTPTIFINGQKINNPSSYDEFRNIIQTFIQDNQ